MKKQIILALIATFFALSACEDYLDVDPVGNVLLQEDAFKPHRIMKTYLIVATM